MEGSDGIFFVGIIDVNRFFICLEIFFSSMDGGGLFVVIVFFVGRGWEFSWGC